MLKVIEGGTGCWGRWQMCRFPGPAWPYSPPPAPQAAAGPRQSGLGGAGIDVEVTKLKSRGQRKGDFFLQL